MTDRTERAVLAGGCFWGMQDLIRRMPGVLSTRVGYTGGDVPNATYRNHGTHAEGIEIIFDPGQISFREILEFFFQIHDPTTINRQGNDVGMSYRSATTTRAMSRLALPVKPSPMSTLREFGRTKSSRNLSQSVTFGKQSPSIRTISSAIRPVTPATLSGLTGSCRAGTVLPDLRIGTGAKPSPSITKIRLPNDRATGRTTAEYYYADGNSE